MGSMFKDLMSAGCLETLKHTSRTRLFGCCDWSVKGQRQIAEIHPELVPSLPLHRAEVLQRLPRDDCFGKCFN